MNDLPDMLGDDSDRPVLLDNKKLSCIQYADDLVLLSETVDGRQNCLNKLGQYCESWNLTVNIKKQKLWCLTQVID